MGKAHALLDLKRGEFKSVEGHMLHSSTDAFKDYLTSGSEWVTIGDLRVVEVPVPNDVRLYSRPDIVEDPQYLVDIPEDL